LRYKANKSIGAIYIIIMVFNYSFYSFKSLFKLENKYIPIVLFWVYKFSKVEKALVL
jgi:hypothetical protein